MRSQQVRELLRREVPRHRQIQRVEGQISTWGNDGTNAMVDDQKRIGLDGLPFCLHQIAKHETSMRAVPVEFQRMFPSVLCAQSARLYVQTRSMALRQFKGEPQTKLSNGRVRRR